jgi:hypothetical protein
MESISKRIKDADLKDLADIVQSKNGEIAQSLVYVVDGPNEIDYDENANPAMLFWDEDMRLSGDLTALEKKVIAMAHKEITKRVVHRSRHGKLSGSKTARGGRKRTKSKRKGRGRRRSTRRVRH